MRKMINRLIAIVCAGVLCFGCIPVWAEQNVDNAEVNETTVGGTSDEETSDEIGDEENSNGESDEIIPEMFDVDIIMGDVSVKEYGNRKSILRKNPVFLELEVFGIDTDDILFNDYYEDSEYSDFGDYDFLIEYKVIPVESSDSYINPDDYSEPWEEYQDGILLEQEGSNVVFVRVTDSWNRSVTVQSIPIELDFTEPYIYVAFDNNSPKNGSYFNKGRTMTLTVQEKNFSPDLVVVDMEAALGGADIPVPAYSWTHDGDLHKAVLRFVEDGDYNISIYAQDKAGNETDDVDYGNSAAATSFTIDKSIEAPVVNGIIDGASYREDVFAEIYAGDINAESINWNLTVAKRDSVVDVTDKFLSLAMADGNTSISGILSGLQKTRDNDGIYVLTGQVTDLAGNTASTSVSFVVNRFGSFYIYDDYLCSIIASGGELLKTLEKDLVVYEYNVSPFAAGSPTVAITRNGEPVQEVITSSQRFDGKTGWTEYKHIISKDNFLEDGIYKIFLSSKDAAGNYQENVSGNITNLSGESVGDEIIFRVDNTPPEIISVTGLEESEIKEDSVKVTYSIYDTMGLKTAEVFLNDRKISHVDDFGSDINNHTGELIIQYAEGTQNLKLVVTDLAGNQTVKDDISFSFEAPSGNEKLVAKIEPVVAPVKEPVENAVEKAADISTANNGKNFPWWALVCPLAAAATIAILYVQQKRKNKLKNKGK